jgi:hypothetical protein
MFYLAVAVNGAHRSQLGKEESQQVLGLTMQPEKEKNRSLTIVNNIIINNC